MVASFAKGPARPGYSGNCSKIRNGAQKTGFQKYKIFTNGDTKVIACSPLQE